GRRQTGDGHVRGVAADVHGVARAGPVDDDAVELAVAPEVGVHARDVGAGEVVDGDRVDAAEGVHVDPLDAVGVHDDVADVAGEAQPRPVRRRLEALG